MVIPGKKCCKKCLDSAKQRSAERYKRLKLERICKSCSNKMLDLCGIYCLKCRQKKKDTVNVRKNSGLCVTCGKNMQSNGIKCKICYVGYQKTTQQRRNARISQGLCALCDGKRINNRLCLKHFLKFTSRNHLETSKRYKELYDLFLKQNGVCPYTKVKLTLGENASVDHIIPKSRGGKINDVSNLQWVYSNVNKEFFNLIGLIAKNLL